MCGIVGLFCKSDAIADHLGDHLSRMLVQMNDRGPDSAGVAVYRDPAPAGSCKLTLQHEDPGYDFETLAAGGYAGHVVVEVTTRRAGEAQRELDLAEALAFARLHLATSTTG